MASRCRFNKKWLRYKVHLKKEDEQKEDEQKEEPMSLWICASIRESAKGDLEYALYNLNPEAAKLISGTLVSRAPLPPMSQTFLDSAVCTISGSRIYVLGGDWGGLPEQKASADVFFIDLDGSKSSSSWSRGPPMLCPRAKPSCVIVDGKVYVFGGHRRDPDRNPPLGEVFDPTTNKWEALPQIPANELYFAHVPADSWVSIAAAGVSDVHGKRYIPVHFFGCISLMGYFLESKSWSCVVISKFEPSSRGMVVVDDVIYSIYGSYWKDESSGIFAYHLRENRFLLVHGNIKAKADAKARLIYVGSNKFWFLVGGTPECHCFNFEVRKNFKVRKKYIGPELESISITSVSSGNLGFRAHGFDGIIAA